VSRPENCGTSTLKLKKLPPVSFHTPGRFFAQRDDNGLIG
jgi:hypothetical protein